MLAGICVELTAVGCTVLEPAFVFKAMFVHEVATADATGVAAEGPLLLLPLPGALLPPVALLMTPVLALVPLTTAFALPPPAHPLTFPPD